MSHGRFEDKIRRISVIAGLSVIGSHMWYFDWKKLDDWLTLHVNLLFVFSLMSETRVLWLNLVAPWFSAWLGRQTRDIRHVISRSGVVISIYFTYLFNRVNLESRGFCSIVALCLNVLLRTRSLSSEIKLGWSAWFWTSQRCISETITDLSVSLSSVTRKWLKRFSVQIS